MDSATEASFCQGTPKSATAKLILAQSKAIDIILARLVVLDPDYDPASRLDWHMILAGRLVADRIERGQYDRMAEAMDSAGGDDALGNLGS